MNEQIINVPELEPRLKHQTIFEVFDNTLPGQSFIIHNDHDPQPLYFQLINTRGEIFSWEYLQRGPEWYDIRVTKTGEPAISQRNGEVYINVPQIEPQLKHQAIFEVFDHTAAGQSFIIHNDHDPRPLYFQLVNQRGDIFTWEYLQQGPEWFDIRVTKNIEEPITIVNGEKTINVPLLQPRIKHETIFNTFNECNPGESFIIHNDHDPKPVYYQLMEQHGDVFTWEYIQQGPDFWDIRVKIKTSISTPEELESMLKPVSSSEKLVPQAKENEIIVNVPSLEPRLKHPTIFETFDKMKGGESFIIHNDHDPKPVYYQLLGEKGDVFTWEYLQEGPEWYDIRVTRKEDEITETIGEIAAKDLKKAEVFKKYGIDFCCGGKKTVRQVCAEKGIDAAQVEKELQQTNQIVVQSNLNFNEWNLDFLADYIVNTHHQFVRKYSPEILAYAEKVAQVHGAQHPELAPVNELVKKVCAELASHMVEEEQELFPLVKHIFQDHSAGKTIEVDANMENLINKMEHEHDAVGRAMEEIRNLTSNYTLPGDSCASYELLFNLLKEFENDLFTHIHLENNVLFPKTLSILF